MKISRVGKNYELTIRNTETLPPYFISKNLKLSKYLSESKDLELLLSDNFNFEELAAVILGMYGIQGFEYYSLFQFDYIFETNNLVLDLDASLEINKNAFINLDLPIYHYLENLPNKENLLYLSIILSDFSILSFEINFKQTNLQPTNGRDYYFLKDKLHKKIENFQVSIDNKKRLLNIKQTQNIGKKIANSAFNNKLFFFELSNITPKFMKFNSSKDTFKSIFNRFELLGVPGGALFFFESRALISDEPFIYDKEIFDEFNKHIKEQEKQFKKKDTKRKKELSKEEDNPFDLSMFSENEKEMLEDLPKEDREKFEKILENQDFTQESFSKIKDTFLKQFVSMLGNLNLDDDKLKNLLADFLDEIKSNDTTGFDGFQVDDLEKEEIIEEIFNLYKQQTQKTDQKNSKKDKKNINLDDVN